MVSKYKRGILLTDRKAIAKDYAKFRCDWGRGLWGALYGEMGERLSLEEGGGAEGHTGIRGELSSQGTMLNIGEESSGGFGVLCRG